MMNRENLLAACALLFVSAGVPAHSEEAPDTVVKLCDIAASSAEDFDKPEGIAPVPFSKIEPNMAIKVCSLAVKEKQNDRRLMYQLGRAYNANKDYYESRTWYERAAELGSVASINNLGVMFDNGLGSKKDENKALSYFEIAANKGLTLAMKNAAHVIFRMKDHSNYNHAISLLENAAEHGNKDAKLVLADAYSNGDFVEKDYKKAMIWLIKASDAGVAAAMYNIGVFYDNGHGVQRDKNEAFKWWEKAALAGDADAMQKVGYCYSHGEGTIKDYTKSREWYEKSAAAGNALAMNNLGALYHNGEGVPKDKSIAKSWYEKARAAGNKSAIENLATLSKSKRRTYYNTTEKNISTRYRSQGSVGGSYYGTSGGYRPPLSPPPSYQTPSYAPGAFCNGCQRGQGGYYAPNPGATSPGMHWHPN